MNHFADRLRHARVQRKLSQAALARACGLSQGAIANYESKRREHAKDIFRLAEALSVNATWLARGTGPMEALPVVEQSTQTTYRLAEHSSPSHESRWPFTRVTSVQYWSLPADERDVVEDTVVSLIHSLQAKTKHPRR